MPILNLTTYKPFEKQQRFHESAAKYRLFGGAAGPGKSTALLWEAIMQANEVKGADTLLLRRTFPELEASLIQPFRRTVPREMYKTFNESMHTIYWHNGSTTRFGYCQGENDVYQYQGAEFLFIGIDELTLFTLKQWQFLTSRNRCPVSKSFPCMAGATNPGNIGHTWVKALGIDKLPAVGMERPDQYDPNDYDFIKAVVFDNPIYAQDESYLKTLRALPTHLRQAFLEGDWDVFAGQYFDVFNIERHTQKSENLQLQPWHPRWVSIDWGFAHDAAVYWHAQTETGKTITYREYVQNNLSPRMLAQAIIDRSSGEKIADVYLSPDAFAKRTSEDTVAEQIGDVLSGSGIPRPSLADNDRIGGWMLMYQLFQSDLWVISTNCPKLIANIPTLTRDEKNLEDCLKMDGDDPADAARYGLKSRLVSPKKPTEVQLEDKVRAVNFTDATSEMMWRKTWQRQMQKQKQPIRFAYRQHRVN